MDARFFAELRNNRGDTLLHDLLRVRLPRIDYVVDNRATAEVRPRNFRLRRRVCVRRRYPSCIAIGIRPKRLVIEIETELAQFPKLIRDVFAGVSNCSVRAHDDLVRLMLVSSGVRFERHDPTALVTSFARKLNHTTLFH